MEEALRCPGTGGRCPQRRHAAERRYELDAVPLCDATCAAWFASRSGREIFGESATYDVHRNPLIAPSRIAFHARTRAQKTLDDAVEDKAWKARFERLEAMHKRERAHMKKEEDP